MDAASILSIADGALTILEKLAPEIEQAVQTGTVTVEQQNAVFTRAANLRPGGVAFTGPEWKPSTQT